MSHSRTHSKLSRAVVNSKISYGIAAVTMDTGRRRVTTVLRILVCLLVVLAQGTPAESRCSFRGKCGIDEDTEKERPCLYTGEGQPMQEEGLSILRELCPHLIEGQAEPKFCCDYPQLVTMKAELEQPLGLGMGKCPTCYSNFVRIFCGFCDPNHSDYIAINRTEPSDEQEGKETVLAVDYAVSEEFAHGAFDSCAHVQSVVTDNTVMQFMCGSKGKDCTAADWFTFLGSTSDENGFAPLKFNYIITGERSITASGVSLKPFNPGHHRCSEPFGASKQRCSCSDCPEVCVALEPPLLPPDAMPFTIGRYDGMLVVSMLLFVLLSAGVLGIFFLKSNRRRSSFRVSGSSESSVSDTSGNNNDIIRMPLHRPTKPARSVLLAAVDLGSLEEVEPLRSKRSSTLCYVPRTSGP